MIQLTLSFQPHYGSRIEEVSEINGRTYMEDTENKLLKRTFENVREKVTVRKQLYN
jgi:hypothetical protein